MVSRALWAALVLGAAGVLAAVASLAPPQLMPAAGQAPPAAPEAAGQPPPRQPLGGPLRALLPPGCPAAALVLAAPRYGRYGNNVMETARALALAALLNRTLFLAVGPVFGVRNSTALEHVIDLAALLAAGFCLAGLPRSEAPEGVEYIDHLLPARGLSVAELAAAVGAAPALAAASALGIRTYLGMTNLFHSCPTADFEMRFARAMRPPRCVRDAAELWLHGSAPAFLSKGKPIYAAVHLRSGELGCGSGYRGLNKEGHFTSELQPAVVATCRISPGRAAEIARAAVGAADPLPLLYGTDNTTSPETRAFARSGAVRVQRGERRDLLRRTSCRSPLFAIQLDQELMFRSAVFIGAAPSSFSQMVKARRVAAGVPLRASVTSWPAVPVGSAAEWFACPRMAAWCTASKRSHCV
eukprot:TRINITY_DN19753_c0_g1_i1.p1 TRINITY_DN19753_c0_g1~~TRINITY_DN19753_c0_g1_i1.p1  ORF type:complete len:413 (+),score=95.29 TRINITY_DN19753_c0_g1_i1:103-1341(+)